MTGPEVLDVARDSILTLVLVSAPLMLVGLVVGVIISLFQALTQIQEMTLVFVPKILAIFAAMLIALPFMGDLDTAQAISIIEEVGADNLYLQYDIYHAQRMEGEIAATLSKHLARIGHIQIADVPERHEPGTGEVNFPFLFDWLDRLGYQGWIGCEYIPAASTEDGLAWIRPYLEEKSAAADIVLAGGGDTIEGDVRI